MDAAKKIDAALYLIPVPLGENPLEQVLPSYNRSIVSSIKHFIVEDIRSARRFLKKTDSSIDIDTLTFFELNEHTDLTKITHILGPLEKGEPMGVISEAGCPAVADPGAAAVALSQKKNLLTVRILHSTAIFRLSLLSVRQKSVSLKAGHIRKIRHRFLLKPPTAMQKCWSLCFLLAARIQKSA